MQSSHLWSAVGVWGRRAKKFSPKEWLVKIILEFLPTAFFQRHYLKARLKLDLKISESLHSLHILHLFVVTKELMCSSFLTI